MPKLEDRTSAQIMVGFAIIAEHAAADLRNAGIDTTNLDSIGKHYRKFAATIDPSTAPSTLRAVR